MSKEPFSDPRWRQWHPPTRPQCNDCRHHQAGTIRCAAYPQGIPKPILLGDHDHHEPYPGDNGIHFEPK